jgi:hypothetical protein
VVPRGLAGALCKHYVGKIKCLGSGALMFFDPRPHEQARYAFPSAANSRNKILAIALAFDPPSVVVLLPCSVLTVTNPWRDVLYEPLTVRPRKSIVNSFQIQSLFPCMQFN